MKPLWTALVLIFSSLPLFADVSKKEVRRLLAAHVSDQTIITYVQKNGPLQPLSIEDLSELKNAGASDRLLQALLEATRPSDAITPPAGTSESYPSQSRTTVIYDTPSPYYTYSPYYVPYTIYPSFFYYRPYRYSAYPYYRRPYPYSSYYYGRPYPYTTTVPRVPVQPGGVHPYRPAQTPRTAPPSRPNPPPQQSHSPRGHVPYR